ncbi:MAG: hypothetical protein HY272_09035 [Gammaproteobacteria bacterium]|nr:hypothetical protein [Gammaproteobacteria bacterium]
MNMQFIKSTKLSTCALITTTLILSACSGGGGSGETSLNGNLNTTDVTTTSTPSSTSTNTSTETSPAVTSSVTTPETAGYLTVPSGFHAGQTATIEGHGYKPQSSYFLTIRDPAGGISTQSVNIGANGSFQFQLTLPQAGLYTATAVDNGTGTEVGKVIVSAVAEDF